MYFDHIPELKQNCQWIEVSIPSAIHGKTTCGPLDRGRYQILVECYFADGSTSETLLAPDDRAAMLEARLQISHAGVWDGGAKVLQFPVPLNSWTALQPSAAGGVEAYFLGATVEVPQDSLLNFYGLATDPGESLFRIHVRKLS